MKQHRLYALLIFLVAFTASGCGDDDDDNGSTAADVTISIVAQNGSNSYSPNPANVTVGQTVSWRNVEGTTHTATQDGGGFDTGNIGNGATSAPITITTAGDLDYHCTIHPTMVGTLHVTTP
jgi:plastocyanin